MTSNIYQVLTLFYIKLFYKFWGFIQVSRVYLSFESLSKLWTKKVFGLVWSVLWKTFLLNISTLNLFLQIMLLFLFRTSVLIFFFGSWKFFNLKFCVKRQRILVRFPLRKNVVVLRLFCLKLKCYSSAGERMVSHSEIWHSISDHDVLFLAMFSYINFFCTYQNGSRIS